MDVQQQNQGHMYKAVATYTSMYTVQLLLVPRMAMAKSEAENRKRLDIQDTGHNKMHTDNISTEG